jgi:hypothetical protein
LQLGAEKLAGEEQLGLLSLSVSATLAQILAASDESL